MTLLLIYCYHLNYRCTNSLLPSPLCPWIQNRKRSLLHIACGFGYDNIIQLLISDSITKNIPLDLNVRDVNGNSPLELSKKMKHIEVTNILVNEIERQTNGFLFNGKKDETWTEQNVKYRTIEVTHYKTIFFTIFNISKEEQEVMAVHKPPL